MLACKRELLKWENYVITQSNLPKHKFYRGMFQDLEQCSWTEVSCVMILINSFLQVLLVFICSLPSFEDYCLLVRVAPRAGSIIVQFIGLQFVSHVM